MGRPKTFRRRFVTSYQPRFLPSHRFQSMPDQSFPKSARLLKSFEFKRVYEANVFAADDTLVIKAVPNETKEVRLGLSVSRKVGNAVVRNRWNRHIREAFRQQRGDFSIGLDIVVPPKRGAICDPEQIGLSLQKLLVRISKKLK